MSAAARGSAQLARESIRRQPVAGRVIATLVQVFGVIGGAIVLLLTLQIAVDVISRNLANRPLGGTLELTSHLFMPLIVFLSLAYAEQTGEHIRATILSARLTPALRRVAETIALLASLVIVLALTYAAIQAAVYSTEIRLEALGAIDLPVWPVKIFAAAGLALFALQLMSTLIRHLSPTTKGDGDDATH